MGTGIGGDMILRTVSSGCLSSLQPTYSWPCDVLISSPPLPAANGNGVLVFLNVFLKELCCKDELQVTVLLTPPALSPLSV